jgi:hypothetical protein
MEFEFIPVMMVNIFQAAKKVIFKLKFSAHIVIVIGVQRKLQQQNPLRSQIPFEQLG